MASSLFEFDTVIRGYHIYKDIWEPFLGKTLSHKQEFGNIHDPYSVSVQRADSTAAFTIVGHVRRTISSVC